MVDLHGDKMIENHFDLTLKKGRRLYVYQMQRCHNPKNDSFATYGGKGIEVQYSLSEFLYWFIQAARFVDLSTISVDRIDPNDHYRFGNIQLLSISENVRKASRQNPQRRRPIEITWDDGRKRVFGSLITASKTIDYDLSALSKIARGKIGKSKKYGFSARYLHDSRVRIA